MDLLASISAMLLRKRKIGGLTGEINFMNFLFHNCSLSSVFNFEFIFLFSWEELSQTDLTGDEKIAICNEMLRSQAYDTFLATKFNTVKRYGGEGAEAMMPFFVGAFKGLSKDGVSQALIGMPHRGRLNLLTGLLELPPRVTFQKMKGSLLFPENIRAVGDVLSHLSKF